MYICIIEKVFEFQLMMQNMYVLCCKWLCFHLLAYPLVARPCHVSCAMRTRNRTPDFGVSSQPLCQCFGQRVEGHVAEFSMGSSFSQVLFQITSACLCFTSVCLACAVVRNGNYILMFGGSRRLYLITL